MLIKWTEKFRACSNVHEVTLCFVLTTGDETFIPAFKVSSSVSLPGQRSAFLD